MEIRKVRLDEIEGVLALIDQFDRKKAEWPDKEAINTIYKSLINSGGFIAGAFLDGIVVGTCTVNICHNFSWSGRPYSVIENVIVTAGHRDKGIGKNLLKFAEKESFLLDCYKVTLMAGSKSQDIHSFYEAAGFDGNKVGYQIRNNNLGK